MSPAHTRDIECHLPSFQLLSVPTLGRHLHQPRRAALRRTCSTITSEISCDPPPRAHLSAARNVTAPSHTRTSSTCYPGSHSPAQHPILCRLELPRPILLVTPRRFVPPVPWTRRVRASIRYRPVRAADFSGEGHTMRDVSRTSCSDRPRREPEDVLARRNLSTSPVRMARSPADRAETATHPGVEIGLDLYLSP